jgi:hypothetical protein
MAGGHGHFREADLAVLVAMLMQGIPRADPVHVCRIPLNANGTSLTFETQLDSSIERWAAMVSHHLPPTQRLMVVLAREKTFVRLTEHSCCFARLNCFLEDTTFKFTPRTTRVVLALGLVVPAATYWLISEHDKVWDFAGKG